MEWEDQFLRWDDAIQKNEDDDRAERFVVIETRKAARGGGELDNARSWQWIESAVRDPERRRFVADVFSKQSIPDRFAHLMLRLGVEETDPSDNRYYIEPAVKALGAAYVVARLASLLREGLVAEKAGAARAVYWVRGDPDDPSYREARTQLLDEMMRQFVANDDLNVRRNILPGLSMHAADYSPEVAGLIPDAIKIARTHPDPYIRHRIEIQLGSAGPFWPLPVS